jgi:hypothetical protein
MHTVEITKPLISEADVFWGEISPCEHLVQIYQDEGVFLDSLERFVAGGIAAGDGVVVIATPQHLTSLSERLTARNIDVAAAIHNDQYLALDAEETLSKFMVMGWPDEDFFKAFVTDILKRAKGNNRRVRAFGEMVALLWARGNTGAPVHLEHLWHRLCQEQSFSLFCAYPKIGFTRDVSASIKEICDAHSRVIPEMH